MLVQKSAQLVEFVKQAGSGFGIEIKASPISASENV